MDELTHKCSKPRRSYVRGARSCLSINDILKIKSLSNGKPSNISRKTKKSDMISRLFDFYGVDNDLDLFFSLKKKHPQAAEIIIKMSDKKFVNSVLLQPLITYPNEYNANNQKKPRKLTNMCWLDDDLILSTLMKLKSKIF